MKKYKASTRGYIKYVLGVVFMLPILLYLLDRPSLSEKPALLLPLITPVVFVIWVFIDTYYKIDNETFFYRSGLLRGKIAISNIKAIENNNTIWIGIKPALATHGMVIKYNIYDEIYVAPVNNLELIKDLLKINPEIEVLYKK